MTLLGIPSIPDIHLQYTFSKQWCCYSGVKSLFWHRASPESVVLAQLAALQRGDVQKACQFMMWPGARSAPQLSLLLGSFQQPPNSCLFNHTEVLYKTLDRLHLRTMA